MLSVFCLPTGKQRITKARQEPTAWFGTWRPDPGTVLQMETLKIQKVDGTLPGATDTTHSSQVRKRNKWINPEGKRYPEGFWYRPTWPHLLGVTVFITWHNKGLVFYKDLFANGTIMSFEFSPKILFFLDFCKLKGRFMFNSEHEPSFIG